jgi:hypothetical protein
MSNPASAHSSLIEKLGAVLEAYGPTVTFEQPRSRHDALRVGHLAVSHV